MLEERGSTALALTVLVSTPVLTSCCCDQSAAIRLADPRREVENDDVVGDFILKVSLDGVRRIHRFSKSFWFPPKIPYISIQQPPTYQILWPPVFIALKATKDQRNSFIPPTGYSINNSFLHSFTSQLVSYQLLYGGVRLIDY